MLATMPRKKKPTPATSPDRHKATVLSFRPPQELRTKLQQLADAERRSLAQIVQFLLEEALEARAKKKGGA